MTEADKDASCEISQLTELEYKPHDQVTTQEDRLAAKLNETSCVTEEEGKGGPGDQVNTRHEVCRTLQQGSITVMRQDCLNSVCTITDIISDLNVSDTCGSGPVRESSRDVHVSGGDGRCQQLVPHVKQLSWQADRSWYARVCASLKL